MDAAIRVVLLDDHAIVREGLAALLVRGGIDVVGQYAEPGAFLNALPSLNADVAVVDLFLDSGALAPSMSGIDVLQTVERWQLPTRTIALSVSRDTGAVEAAHRAGASAYLYKLDTTAPLLLEMIRAVHRGERLMSVTSAELFPQAQAAVDPGPIGDLSPRESQVLGWIGTGADNLKIAAHLAISERTVSSHITSIYRKLGKENRTELALLACALRLTPHA